MEKKIFKAGDSVFDIRFGWGVVAGSITDITDTLFVCVDFNNKKIERKEYKNSEMKLLSFTEYTLQGFSQERPIDWDGYKGKWGKFYDDCNNKNFCIIDKLESFDDSQKYPFNAEFCNSYYKHFEPLTEEQIKILGLE